MRHRSSRPFLDLWRRRTSVRPLHRGLLVTAAVALFGIATGLAVAAQHQAGLRPRPHAAALPTSAPAPTARAPHPSRSADRSDRRRASQRTPSGSAAPSGASNPAGTPTPSLVPSTSLPSPTVPSPHGPPQVPTGSAVPDTTAPDTTASTVSSNDRTWVVALGASEPADFRCNLDGAGYRTCSRTAVFRDVAPGHHTLLVRAVDRAGNPDPTPAELTAQVNASPS